MNWLAHLYLADPDAEHRLGNLLADFIKGKDRKSLPPRMQDGIRCHQAVDAFTDFHPRVMSSKNRIHQEQRRYAGIIVDIFYDHFLARHWLHYSETPFEAFTADVYAALRAFALTVPSEGRDVIERVTHDDLLGTYRTVDGIEEVLARLSRRLAERWQREVRLQEAVADMRAHYDELHADFTAFFPELCEHIEKWKQVQSPIV